jgi:DNA repair protein RecO (recombination protein O)|tara:strand:+ start:4036 stop:4755 length:720 start_codon:yes stop_codon:yes gene_type:complete
MSNSKGFVVKSIKNGETSMIVSCYLDDIGLQSFIVKGIYGTKNNKFRKAHFFPLNFISIDYSVSKTGRLGYINEVKPLKLYKSLHSNVEKSAVIIFLSEILNSIFKEEGEENKNLFNFLDRSLNWYDNQESCNNFHIKFLIELTRYIGFYPNISSEKDKFFNLESGSSSSIKPISKSIDFDDYCLFTQLLGMKFEDLNYMEINKNSRLTLLNHIIDYYSLHLQMFKSPKSIDILSEVFK